MGCTQFPYVAQKATKFGVFQRKQEAEVGGKRPSTRPLSANDEHYMLKGHVVIRVIRKDVRYFSLSGAPIATHSQKGGGLIQFPSLCFVDNRLGPNQVFYNFLK